jgi:hypothetical protein
MLAMISYYNFQITLCPILEWMEDNPATGEDRKSLVSADSSQYCACARSIRK